MKFLLIIRKKRPQAYFKKYNDMPHKERALCEFSICHIIVEGEAFLLTI